MSLHVLYNKNGVLVVNKGVGVCSDFHAGERVSSMEVRVRDLFPGYIPVHRIDKWTSGILGFASTDVKLGKQSVYKWVRANWKDRVTKEYLAVMPYPNWTSIEVDMPLPDGDGTVGPAKTRFEVIQDSGRGFVLVKCTLIKGGKKHQIRLHARESGVPLVGDFLYGGERSRFRNGQLLHAWKLNVNFPYEKMLFQAPIPDDFKGIGFVFDELDHGANKVTIFG